MILRNTTHALIISLGRNRNEAILEKKKKKKQQCDKA